MGSPLGVSFANFYMCHIENQVLETSRPATYCRYVDDCYVVVDDGDSLEELRRRMEAASSVLRFTTELGLNGTLNFLDVHIDANTGQYVTSTYKNLPIQDLI